MITNNNTILWHKSYKPWLNINTYVDISTGEELPAEIIPGNYIIIKIDKHVRTTKTHRIAERTIVCRKPQYKQQSLW